MWLSHLERRRRFRSSGGEKTTEIRLFSQFCSTPNLLFKDSRKQWLNPTRIWLYLSSPCAGFWPSPLCVREADLVRGKPAWILTCGCQGEDCVLEFLTERSSMWPGDSPGNSKLKILNSRYYLLKRIKIWWLTLGCKCTINNYLHSFICSAKLS